MYGAGAAPRAVLGSILIRSGRYGGGMSPEPIDTSRRSRRRVYPITYVALGVSVITAGTVWLGQFDTGGADPIDVLLVIAVFLLAGVVLNIIAGTRGGINRLIGIFGGLILLSTVLLYVILIVSIESSQINVQL